MSRTPSAATTSPPRKRRIQTLAAAVGTGCLCLGGLSAAIGRKRARSWTATSAQAVAGSQATASSFHVKDFSDGTGGAHAEETEGSNMSFFSYNEYTVNQTSNPYRFLPWTTIAEPFKNTTLSALRGTGAWW